MKKISLLNILFIILIMSCTTTTKEGIKGSDNPLLQSFDTPFNVPPFDKIETRHFMPAFEEALKSHKKEIEKIVANKDSVTFQNTIEAIEYSGEMLQQVNSIFFCLYYANTSDSLNHIAETISAKLAEHNDNIFLSDKLFKKVSYIYEQPARKLRLKQEEKRLLDFYYKKFIQSGALLDKSKKELLRDINKELAMLEMAFAKNVLNETNAYKLVLEDPDDLAGLSEDHVAIAAQEALANGLENKWVFTLQKPSVMPFLQYLQHRGLREKIFKAYINRGDNNNKSDNKEIITRIVNLRLEKAQLLGFENHAQLVLDDCMAKTPERVYSLLEDIWYYGLPKAQEEATELQKLVYAEGNGFDIQPWDWWYYAEKLRKEKYHLDEDSIKPYFELKNVRAGAFYLANKLWGIKFLKLKDMPVYEKDVEVFQVLDTDNTHLGILYTDYFPRESKRAGAWMDQIKTQHIKNGKNIRPVIMNVGNFTKPTADKPSLLTLEEVETLFHEFGHALHGMLSQCTYPSLSGVNVPRDFVELPSQFFENWATEPEMLKQYARHYKTNEIIPDNLIQKIQTMSQFNQGFSTVELTSAAIMDMDWHTILDKTDMNVNLFEKQSMDNICLIPEILPRYRSVYFSHIFSLGYDAGYYSYIWSEVLDADAFEAFKKTGDIFNPKLAESFRKNILEKGNTVDPVILYRNFRGHEPKADALLKRRGLK